MLCNDVSLTVQQFEHNALSPEFPGAVSSLDLLEDSCLFREYLKCIQFKSCVKSASHYFYCFNGFKSVTIVVSNGHVTQSRLYVLLIQSQHQRYWMFHHVITLYNPLIVNSTQGILYAIEYLLFQIKYFQKRHIFEGLIARKLWGRGGGRRPLCPSAPLGLLYQGGSTFGIYDQAFCENS